MPLEPGSTLGVYEVLAKIGQGGMGEVYRARDTKLDRDVALKALPEAFVNDAERLARFQREAKVLASLNHPNIAQIYGLEEAESGGAPVLVLEYVDGPTLQERIATGPIELDEALPLARQIAEALEAAHEQGIIHRDLKPANVKVRDDGTVKVLDFGLAKALEPERTDVEAANSPTMTMTAAATQAGFIMGTAAYMAPEQAKGRPVDKRADVWAFGVVLYEMLTGRQAFGGTDISETLAAVLKTDLDLDSLPSAVPHGIRRLLRRCLQKDRTKRARDIGDVRLDLEEAAAAPDAAAQPIAAETPAPLSVWQRPIIATLSLFAALALGAAAAVTLLRPEPMAPVVTRVSIPVEQFTLERLGRVVAVAPDASYVVYSGPGPQLWLREADQLEARPIPGTEGAAQPFLSPDGRWIGFHANDQLMRIEVAGGAAIPIAEVAGIGGASWNDDGTILYTDYERETFTSGIIRVADAGGTPEVLIRLSTGEFASFPQLLPGGDWILFTMNDVAAGGQRLIVAQSVSSGDRVVLIEGAQDGRYLQTGHLVYGANGILLGAPFDPATPELVGGPVPLVEGVLTREDPPAYQFHVAANGTLAYIPGLVRERAQRSLTWVDRAGAEDPVPVPPASFIALSLSPDGDQVAVGREDGGDEDVWVADLQRGALAPLTTDPAADRRPLWSLDGRTIVFESTREGRPGLYRKSADGTGDAERIVAIDGATGIEPSAWTPDGSAIVAVIERRQGNDRDIALVPVDPGGEWQPLLDSDQFEWYPAVSPDGRWLAYASTESGQNQVYVRRFPEMTDRQPISIDGGWGAMWSRDGTELFYFAAPNGPPQAMVSVAIEIDGETMTAGQPEHLFDWPYFNRFGSHRRYDIAPADGRFLTLATSRDDTDLDGENEIVVVLNWFEELNERVPVP